jgi:hypothetical protein
MERPSRRHAIAGAAGIVLATLAGGCHHFRSDHIPPERPYVTPGAEGQTGSPPPPIGFSTEPAPSGFSAAAQPFMPAGGNPAAGQPTGSPLDAMPGISGATPGNPQ